MMFSWFLNLLRRWIIERRRAIFRYWDGRRLRKIDPMEVLRALRADKNYDQAAHLPLVDAGDEDAIRITANAVRSAFGAPAFADGGLSELELCGVLVDFLTFLATLKKSTDTPQSSPQAVEPLQPLHSPEDDSTTRLPSECTSTSIGSNCSEPAAC